jgi:signal transduction histidine kinase
MPSLSQMKFSRKVFLAIFGMATFTALVISVVLYLNLSRGRHQEFAESYIDHMKLFAKALAGIEDAEAQIARNAAEMVRLQGPLKDAQRTELAKYLGVDEINIYSSRAEILNIFPSLPDYAGGPSSVFQTPMIKGADGRVGQHSLIASKDGARIIEVMMDFDDITQLLRDMTYHDEDNLAVELFNPEKESLGRIQREGFQAQTSAQDILQKEDGAHWQKDRMIVVTSITHENKPKNRLVATISTRSLEKELQKIQQILLLVCAALVLVSWALAKFLTTLLLGKIESIRRTLAKITDTQDYSQRVPVSDQNKDPRNELEQLGHNLNFMLETMQSHQMQLIEAERDKAKSQIAAQVAHDIRSPLMSMHMALGQMNDLTLEPLALIKSAVTRIAGIVQKLGASVASKADSTPTVESPKLTLVEPLIAGVVHEHRARQNPDQTLKLQGVPAKPGTWSVLQVSEIQSAISNLINNAYEAGATVVTLIFSTENKQWRLEIQDNGHGIPAHLREKIFERSFTHGKKTGTGLGLFQAKSATEWSGGSLSVTSTEGRGSQFTINIPLEKKPSWLPEGLEAEADQQLCFVDDDHIVLNTWKQKCTAAGFTNTQFFGSAEEFQSYIKENTLAPDALVIVDQNLGGKTGLQILAELHRGRQGYLCTTEFDEVDIQNQVKKLNAHLIPKILISQFEMKVKTRTS